MKIAVDASQVKAAEADGIAGYSYYLLRALSNLDQPHQFVLFFKKGPSVQVRREIFKGKSLFDFRVLEPAPFWRQTALAKACLREKPDLLFVPGATLPVVRRRFLKTVVTVHDLCFEYLPEKIQFPQNLFLGKSVQYASYAAFKVIAVSQATKEALVERFEVDPKKISVVHEGVAQKKFQISNSKLQKQKGEKIKKKYEIGGDYVLFVGTVQPRKNLRRVIEAFSKVRETSAFPSRPDLSGRVFPAEVPLAAPLELVIAGRPGWLFDDIYKAPKDFGVEDRVRFLGSVPDEDLPLLYQDAKVFLFPSLCEGFGLPILEAMAAGTPVITSNISSMPEVGGDAAYYVDPCDVADITHGLQRVLTDDNLRQTLISSGKKRSRMFSWRRTAKETLKVFESC